MLQGMHGWLRFCDFALLTQIIRNNRARDPINTHFDMFCSQMIGPSPSTICKYSNLTENMILSSIRWPFTCYCCTRLVRCQNLGTMQVPMFMANCTLILFVCVVRQPVSTLLCFAPRAFAFALNFVRCTMSGQSVHSNNHGVVCSIPCSWSYVEDFGKTSRFTLRHSFQSACCFFVTLGLAFREANIAFIL